MSSSRRHRPLAALVLAWALVLSACANPDPSGGPIAVSSQPAGDAFPVTVAHKYGTTTIEQQPERVVSVGLTEQDVLLELGVVPIATTEWYGEQPYAVWPWARELLGEAKPTVLSTAEGFEFEKIASLRPDLIIGTNAGITQEDYDKLTKIAPTVTSIAGSEQYFSAWDDQAMQIARAVGQESKGKALVAEVEKAYAAAAAAHPDFAGKVATFAQGEQYEGELYVYPDGLNTDFLTDLGLTITPGLEPYQPEPDSQAQISAERLDLIDADVIVFATESKAGFDKLQSWSTIKNLGAVREQRAVYTDGTLAGAIYFLTPLSLKYVLAELTPRLQQAVDKGAPRSYPG